MTRKVEYFETEWVERNYKIVSKGTATFHQFGLNCLEGEDSIGTYSTAILELEDGTVLNHPVHMIKFLDKSMKEVK